MAGVGVDIVDLARIAESNGRAPGRLAARVCTESERAWIAAGDETERLAACFAVKEAWIKAVGGRPVGFRWTDVEFDAKASAIGGLSALWTRSDDMVIARVGEGRGWTMQRVLIGSSIEGLTRAELAYCNGSPPRLAGRVAAKRAIRAFVHDDDEIEVLPGEHPPDELVPCRGSHPPQVFVNGVASHVHVSITHGHTLAVAVAWIG